MTRNLGPDPKQPAQPEEISPIIDAAIKHPLAPQGENRTYSDSRPVEAIKRELRLIMRRDLGNRFVERPAEIGPELRESILLRSLNRAQECFNCIIHAKRGNLTPETDIGVKIESPRIVVITGTGYNHYYENKPSQDTFAIIQKGELVVVVVCDGVSGCKNSRLGAELLARHFVEQAWKAAETLGETSMFNPEFVGRLHAEAVLSLYEVARVSGLDPVKDGKRGLTNAWPLSTTLSVMVMTPTEVGVFGVDDGYTISNGEIQCAEICRGQEGMSRRVAKYLRSPPQLDRLLATTSFADTAQFLGELPHLLRVSTSDKDFIAKLRARFPEVVAYLETRQVGVAGPKVDTEELMDRVVRRYREYESEILAVSVAGSRRAFQEGRQPVGPASDGLTYIDCNLQELTPNLQEEPILLPLGALLKHHARSSEIIGIWNEVYAQVQSLDLGRYDGEGEATETGASPPSPFLMQNPDLGRALVVAVEDYLASVEKAPANAKLPAEVASIKAGLNRALQKNRNAPEELIEHITTDKIYSDLLPEIGRRHSDALAEAHREKSRHYQAAANLVRAELESRLKGVIRNERLDQLVAALKKDFGIDIEGHQNSILGVGDDVCVVLALPRTT